jgi:hypothetical protein
VAAVRLSPKTPVTIARRTAPNETLKQDFTGVMTMRNQKRILVAFAVVLAPSLFWARSTIAQQRPAEPKATHNMLVIGERAVYLSHLPMFQDPKDLKKDPAEIMPHRFQAIFEVTFDQQEKYVKDRHAAGAPKFYTLGPKEKFVLSDLTKAGPDAQPSRSFTAEAFRGHLEKQLPDSKGAILDDLKVRVTRVVHFREFDPKATRPAHLEYLLFGKGGELFLAHLIVAPPDFDQLLAVKITGREFTDEELAKGVVVAFAGTANTPAGRLQAKQKASGELTSGSTPSAAKLQIEVSGELFFEEGELRVPAVFATTPEEKRAGFP